MKSRAGQQVPYPRECGSAFSRRPGIGGSGKMSEKLAHMQGVARLRRDGTSRLFNTLFSSDSSPAHFLSRLLLSLTAMSEPPTSECSYAFPDDRWERCVNSAAFDDACAECAREVHLGSLSDDSDSDYRYHGNLLETDSSSLSPYDVS